MHMARVRVTKALLINPDFLSLRLDLAHQVFQHCDELAELIFAEENLVVQGAEQVIGL
jgi:hypothetical protein